jgi:hypothetical protein
MRFLRCTFNNLGFCLVKVFELPLTIVINKTCFVTNSTNDLALFTSNKVYIKPIMKFLLATTSIDTITKFGTSVTTKSSDKTSSLPLHVWFSLEMTSRFFHCLEYDLHYSSNFTN